MAKTNRGLRVSVALVLCIMGSAAQANLFGTPAGMKKDCLEKNSKAFCVIDAGGLSHGIKDVSKEKVVKALNAAPASGTGASAGQVADLLGAVGAFTHVWTNKPPLVGNAAEGGLFLLSLFLQGRSQIEGLNQVVAWMPYEMAGTREEAWLLMADLMEEATKKSFEGMDIRDETRLDPRGKTSAYNLETAGWEQSVKVMHQGPCGQTNCMLSAIKAPRDARGTFVTISPPREGTAPEWAGGGKAWVFRSAFPRDLWIGNELMTHRYVGDLSRNLPTWAYVVASAEARWRFDELSGIVVNKGMKLPLVFHQGKPMAMIFPEFDLEQASVKSEEQRSGK